MIDTRTVSASIALLALGVQRRLERGTTDEEIDAFVARYQTRPHAALHGDTLEYLAKGGRIGRAAALAGNLLNVKPILTIRDGEVVPLKRVRGNAKAFAEFRALFESTSTDSSSLKVGIAHAAAPERLEALRKLVEHVRPHAEIEIATTLGAVVGTHAGPGTVGFFWFEDGVTSGPGPKLRSRGDDDPRTHGFSRRGPARLAASARLGAAAAARRARRRDAARRRGDDGEAPARVRDPDRA